jgi:putative solute:sodium symporter small subunit
MRAGGSEAADRGNPPARQRAHARTKGVQAMQVSETHRHYWQKNLRMTAILMAIWFVVTFVVGYFARDLNFNFFGWPFSFWVGAQGALVIYVLIIAYYAHYMNKLDQEHGVAEEE